MHGAHRSTQSAEKLFILPAGGSDFFFFKYRIKAEHTNNFS